MGLKLLASFSQASLLENCLLPVSFVIPAEYDWPWEHNTPSGKSKWRYGYLVYHPIHLCPHLKQKTQLSSKFLAGVYLSKIWWNHQNPNWYYYDYYECLLGNRDHNHTLKNPLHFKLRHWDYWDFNFFALFLFVCLFF